MKPRSRNWSLHRSVDHTGGRCYLSSRHEDDKICVRGLTIEVNDKTPCAFTISEKHGSKTTVEDNEILLEQQQLFERVGNPNQLHIISSPETLLFLEIILLTIRSHTSYGIVRDTGHSLICIYVYFTTQASSTISLGPAVNDAGNSDIVLLQLHRIVISQEDVGLYKSQSFAVLSQSDLPPIAVFLFDG